MKTTIIQKETENLIFFQLDGKEIGWVQAGDTSMHDAMRGSKKWYGEARLTNRIAGSSGKKAEVLSTVKRQLRESYDAKIRKA